MAQPDSSPTANQMAADRTWMAQERTLMAWIRTATSMITFGFTIYKFFEYVNQSGQTAPQRRIGPREYGMLMIITGVIVLAIATFEHFRAMRQIRKMTGRRIYSIATIPAALISVLGLVALIAVWLRF